MKALRAMQGITAEQLCSAMAEQGLPFNTSVLANLETGRRRYVTVAELLALAYVLGVAPVHLLRPAEPEFATTPATSHRAARFEHWLRGEIPLSAKEALTFLNERLRDTSVSYSYSSRRKPDGTIEARFEVDGEVDGDG